MSFRNHLAKCLTVAFVCSIGPAPLLAEEDESLLEEVVVTGSYLKRTTADSPSPLSVVTSADIEDLGAADVSEIIQSMPWSSGSQTRATTFQGEGADGRNSINLRNLGHGATLPLINGKRQVASWYNMRGNASVNVNGLIPNIAMERIEIVKDGAAALYGSDAVAGVVNFITKRNYEGMDFSYQYTIDDETGEGEAHTFALIWGVQGDRGGLVASASVLNRAEINVDDNYSRYGGTTISSTGQPGRLTPIPGQTIIWASHTQAVDNLGISLAGRPVGNNTNPPRDPAGNSFGQADVNCEDSAALERGGALGNLFNRCIYDYGSFFSIQAQESLRKIHLDGHFDITDDVEMYFQLAANESEFDRLNSLNPNAPALRIPAWVSYVDSDGNAQRVANPGSHEDAWRRGILPIDYVNLTRLIGGTANTPFEQRPLDTFTKSHRSDQRYLLGATWDMNLLGREWALDVSYTASQHNTATTQVQDTLSTHIELALNGFGGPNCDPFTGVPGSGNQAYAASGGVFDAGDCYFFNPFGNSLFRRDGSVGQTENLALVNPRELYQWLVGRASSDLQYRQQVLDVVFSGDVFDLPAGAAGLAVGFQRRHDDGHQVYDSALTSSNLDFAFGATDWDGSLTATALFVELGMPVHRTVDLNLALRMEDFDQIGESSTDPKITLLWRPLESLSVRASTGSSFRVPSLQQSFGFLTTVDNQADADELGGTAFKPSVTAGNPNLKPESADNFNIGISWQPQGGVFEGLSLDADFYNYEYEDIITRESSVNLLSEDIAALRAYTAANPGSSFIDAVNAGAGNRQQVIRNPQAILLRLLPNFTNANEATIRGIDLNVSYSFGGPAGDWRVGIQAAYAMDYDVVVPNRAGGTTRFDGIGNYNQSNPVARPLPQLLANATLNWSLHRHRVFAILKYVDGLTTDVPAGTRGFFAATARLAGNNGVASQLTDNKIQAMKTLDVQYTYNFGDFAFLSDSSLSVGIQNLANEEAPPIAVVTAYDPRLHDGRGRLLLLRFSGSL